MITHHVRCLSEDIEKNIDLILHQNSFSPFILTIESVYNRKNKFYAIFFYINEKKWVVGIDSKVIDFANICFKLLQTSKPKEKLINIFEKKKIPYLESCKPYSFIPVDVEKPWGKEVWFTGIEDRGVSLLNTPIMNIPIYYLNAIIPKRLKGMASDSDFILLKLLKSHGSLDGDLYIEIHEYKEEVYIVDAIDRRVYPEGVASILYGYNEEKLNELGEEKYKKLLFEKIIKYEALRYNIDNGIDIEIELKEKSQKEYEEIRNWFGVKKVREGDVLTIGKRVPHSISHGISVVEFQNAYYERKIIAFNQKVLTQSGWDVKEAFDLMDFKISSENKEEVILYKDDRYTEKELVCFEDYIVSKVEMSPSYRHLIYAVDSYQILYCLNNSLEIETETSSISISKGESLFVPVQTNLNVYNSCSEKISFLLAYPNI